MNIIDFFLMEQKRLHSWMRADVSDLTRDEWHYKPHTCTSLSLTEAIDSPSGDQSSDRTHLV